MEKRIFSSKLKNCHSCASETVSTKPERFLRISITWKNLFDFSKKEMHHEIAYKMENLDLKFPLDLEKILLQVFWLYQLGILYFWLWDKSENRKKTNKILEISLVHLFRVVNIFSLPIMKRLRKPILEIYKLIVS